jgi:isocitrate lyase
MADKTPYQPPASEFANRWEGVLRPYSKEEVDRLRGSVQVAQTLADRGSKRLWQLMNEEPFVPALGALTGGQAVQQVKAGLKAIYCSGWQVNTP